MAKANQVVYDVAVKKVALTEEEMLALAKKASPVGYGEVLPFYPGDYAYQKAIVGVVVTAPVSAGVPALDRLVLNVDVQDIIDSGVEVIDAEVAHVTFNKAFNVIPDVTATQVAGASLATVNVSNITETGFDIELRDASNALVAGTITWTARGI